MTTLNAPAPSRLGSVLRSLLFVPAINDRYIDKAHIRGADGIVLDLEDSIADSEKAAARRKAPAGLERLAANGVRNLLVRINSSPRLTVHDLEAVVVPALAGVILPKCRSADHVRAISEIMLSLELERGFAPGSIALGVRVETADAFFHMHEIAAADPRVAFFGLGGEDFSLAIGVEPSVDTLLYPKQQAVIAARAAGVSPIGLISSGADFTNLDAIRDVVRQSRRFGFQGASCIHPAIVPILNEEFSPSPADVERAERLVQAFRDGIEAGTASVSFEGKMVDYPVAFRAERLLADHAAIAALAKTA
ncbi:CoA ester lyase [Shinella yambaruensis]|uniref:CoA ester lyase n=1 Tax=Shinella yambaruensis TaxID=415996 RepID=A0ABQ5ZS01_9HYPH|nr:CoA ester lyase [Shinella yambaruensis]MCJ8026290.1 CoA ester lyase [Shinella yambaruensis]MCU7981697.1 CoA ester lyase [Shinella yambaruensis]GLR53643.1 CoA ester lyase [Shinella yambaruensis]